MADTDDEKAARSEHYKRLQDGQLDGESKYDAAMLAIAPALLGFSLLFIKDVVKLESAIYIWFLYISWAMLVFSIGSVIVSYRLSVRTMRIKLGIMHSSINSSYEDLIKALKQDMSSKYVEYANWASGLSLLFGFILLSVFIHVNIESRREAVMSEKLIQEGAVPTLPRPITSGQKGITPPPPRPVQSGGTQGGQSGSEGTRGGNNTTSK